jgi:putative flippase GtrA
VSKLKHELVHLLRYGGSGVVNTAVGVSTILMLTLIGASPILSNVGGYLTSLCLGFFISKKFVFLSNGQFAGESMRYVFSFSFSFALNLLVLWASLNLIHIHEVFAQLLAAGTYTLVMYILSRFFVFKSTNYSTK